MFTNKIRKALINLIREVIQGNKIGIVKSVDETKHTCIVEPIGGGVPYYDVRLNTNATSAIDGLVCIPDIDSEVIISPLNNDAHAWFVSKFEKVKKWHLNTVSNGIIELDATGNIKLNNTTFGGVPKAGTIATKLNVLEAQENALKTIVTAILAAGTSAPTTPVTNGTLAALFTSFNVAAITPTTQANLENTKVKHG